MYLLKQNVKKARSLSGDDALWLLNICSNGAGISEYLCNCHAVFRLSSDKFSVLCCSVTTHGSLEQAYLASEPCVNLCTDVTVASGCEATVKARENCSHIWSCSVFPSQRY